MSCPGEGARLGKPGLGLSRGQAHPGDQLSQPATLDRVFDTLSDRLTSVLQNLRGRGRLSEADVDATAREIRIALLEADVALPVVRTFIAQIKERAKGAEVSGALNPAQQVVKIVNEELVAILGGQTRTLNLAKNPPTVILLAGLQGAGKTTLAGKLALHLKAQGHTPLLVAADLQRPNAVTQLQVVGERAGVPVFAPHPGNQGSEDLLPFGAEIEGFAIEAKRGIQLVHHMVFHQLSVASAQGVATDGKRVYARPAFAMG